MQVHVIVIILASPGLLQLRECAFVLEKQNLNPKIFSQLLIVLSPLERMSQLCANHLSNLPFLLQRLYRVRLVLCLLPDSLLGQAQSS